MSEKHNSTLSPIFDSFENHKKVALSENYKNDKQDGPKGMTVVVRNDDVNKAMRIFKKKITEDGIIQEYRARQEYIKPREKRRKAKKAGIARWKKKQAKEDEKFGGGKY